MDKTGKKLLNRFRNLQASCGSAFSKSATEFSTESYEVLSSNTFSFAEISRHGFPYQPTCLAFDPVQKLIAIGSDFGIIRIFGRFGVDSTCKYDEGISVRQINFLINEGFFVALTSDNSVSLWDIKLKRPELVQTLQFQKEILTVIHLPCKSKWLFLGTDKGNVHVANVSSFSLSGYVINWNKAINVSQRTHPGAIVALNECPTDENKLLIGFTSGLIAIWDLKAKQTDLRVFCEINQTRRGLTCVAWHLDGKQFVSGHQDGTLSVWTLKKPSEPKTYSRIKEIDDASLATSFRFRPVTRVEWSRDPRGDDLIFFSGGEPLSVDQKGQNAETDKNAETDLKHHRDSRGSVAILRGDFLCIIHTRQPTIDFLTLTESPYAFDESPNLMALAILMPEELLLLDPASENYNAFENPHSCDFNESPITMCLYLVDCPSDLIPLLYSMGVKQQKRKKSRRFSEKPWPIKGGNCGDCAFSYSELFITGHEDGSVKFWDASSTSMQLLYKLRTHKLFDWKSWLQNDDPSFLAQHDPNFLRTLLAVDHLDFCSESRHMALAGRSGHVILLKLDKHEKEQELCSLILQFESDKADAQFQQVVDKSSPSQKDRSSTCPLSKRAQWKQQSSVEVDETLGDQNAFLHLKIKEGAVQQSAGFVSEFICLTKWASPFDPDSVTCLSYNSAYNLLAYATRRGLFVIDTCQQNCILAMHTQDLYGGSLSLVSESVTSSITQQKSLKYIGKFYQRGSRDTGSESESGTVSTACPTDVSLSYFSRQKQQPASPPSSVRQSSSLISSHQLLTPSQSVQSPIGGGNSSPRSPLPKKSQQNASMSTSATSSQHQVDADKSSDPSTNSTFEKSPSSFRSEVFAFEHVTCLSFIDCNLSKKNESYSGPTLWAGTNNGRAFILNLKVDFACRTGQPCAALPTGLVVDTDCGHLLKLAFIDQNLDLLLPPAELYKRSAGITTANLVSRESLRRNRTAYKSRSSIAGATGISSSYGSSPPTAASSFDRQSSYTQVSEASPIGGSFSEQAVVFPTPSAAHQYLVAIGERGACLIAVEALNKPVYFVQLSSQTFAADRKPNENQPAAQTAPFFIFGDVICTPPSSNDVSSSSSSASCNLPLVACLSNDCQLFVYSLPQLQLLFEHKICALDNINTSIISRTFRLSQRCQGIFMCSPCEAQKFTFWSQLAEHFKLSESQTQLDEMVKLHTSGLQTLAANAQAVPQKISRHGSLTPSTAPGSLKSQHEAPQSLVAESAGLPIVFSRNVKTPEPPKRSFFREFLDTGVTGLVLSGSSTNRLTERQELFGESSGQALRSTAKVIPGSSNLNQISRQSTVTGGEVGKTKMALVERGEKLNMVDEKTALMMENARSYASNAKAMAEKYKADSKWYKFF